MRVVILCPGGDASRLCSGDTVVVDASGDGLAGQECSVVDIYHDYTRRSILVEAVYHVSVAEEIIVTGDCRWAVPVTLAVLGLLYGAKLYVDGSICGEVGELLLRHSSPLPELLHPGEPRD